MKAMIVACFVLALSNTTFAKGGGGGHGHSGSHSTYSSMPSYGTGSKPEHTQVNGYVKHDGTYVAPHERSTPDHTKNNNWDTKGNYNLDTGKAGSKRGDD